MCVAEKLISTTAQANVVFAVICSYHKSLTYFGPPDITGHVSAVQNSDTVP